VLEAGGLEAGGLEADGARRLAALEGWRRLKAGGARRPVGSKLAGLEAGWVRSGRGSKRVGFEADGCSKPAGPEADGAGLTWDE
jgi:hypothetical protein